MIGVRGQRASVPSRTSLDSGAVKDRCMGNLDLMQRVLDKFEKRLPDEWPSWIGSSNSETPRRLPRLAHRIKGNSSNVSAAGLRQAAEEIENLGRAGSVADSSRRSSESAGTVASAIVVCRRRYAPGRRRIRKRRQRMQRQC